MKFNDIFHHIYPGAITELGPDLYYAYEVDENGDFTRWDEGLLGPQPTDAEWLQMVKDAYIDLLNDECTKHIYAKWPQTVQDSFGIGGIYTTADQEECEDDINAMVAYSNTLSDSIDAATTVDAVQSAFQARSWPTI